MLAGPSSKKSKSENHVWNQRVFRGLHLHELPILFSFAQVTSAYPTFLSKVCFVRLLELIFVLITLCLISGSNAQPLQGEMSTGEDFS